MDVLRALINVRKYDIHHQNRRVSPDAKEREVVKSIYWLFLTQKFLVGKYNILQQITPIKLKMSCPNWNDMVHNMSQRTYDFEATPYQRWSIMMRRCKSIIMPDGFSRLRSRKYSVIKTISSLYHMRIRPGLQILLPVFGSQVKWPEMSSLGSQ